jgi:hypothetical protein
MPARWWGWRERHIATERPGSADRAAHAYEGVGAGSGSLRVPQDPGATDPLGLAGGEDARVSLYHREFVSF